MGNRYPWNLYFAVHNISWMEKIFIIWNHGYFEEHAYSITSQETNCVAAAVSS